MLSAGVMQIKKCFSMLHRPLCSKGSSAIHHGGFDGFSSISPYCDVTLFKMLLNNHEIVSSVPTLQQLGITISSSG